MNMLPTPTQVNELYVAGRQWTLPIPVMHNGRRLNLDGLLLTAIATRPDGVEFGAQVSKMDPQLSPSGLENDNTGIAYVVITNAQSATFVGQWELNLFLENEPAGWYRFTAQQDR